MLFTIYYLLFTIYCSSAQAITLDEVNAVHSPAYRLGLTDEPEKEYREEQGKQEFAKKDNEQIDMGEFTYADLSIKQMSREISRELALEQDIMLSDLSMLWQGAATRSDTINFALYKLANPEEDKPDEKSVKNVLKTIASMSTLVGAGIGHPVLATGSLIGGNILGIMSQDTKALNYKYTRVTDADMIILVRKVEDLQQKTINLYYDYMTTRKKFDMIAKMAEERKANYNRSQKFSREVILIADAYYRTALDAQMKARSDFFAKRAALEQFVGNETFTQFEEMLKERQ
ncbi:MAG: hypothetical protein LBK53_03975 [Heliobacteriaceae bacterium]|nr:hypothetical protein [Heliobacteriaceae bacterium]